MTLRRTPRALAVASRAVVSAPQCRLTPRRGSQAASCDLPAGTPVAELAPTSAPVLSYSQCHCR